MIKSDLLLRHSLSSERQRYSFITQYNLLVKRALTQMLLYSQTGNDINLTTATHILYFELPKVLYEFALKFGYDE